MLVLPVKAKALKDIDDLPKDYEAPDFFLKEAEQMMLDWSEFDKNHKCVYNAHITYRLAPLSGLFFYKFANIKRKSG